MQGTEGFTLPKKKSGGDAMQQKIQRCMKENPVTPGTQPARPFFGAPVGAVPLVF
jgi:hypothetical protein